jgi:hypothetical protein
MLLRFRYKGFLLLGDALVWEGEEREAVPLLLSAVGPREALKALGGALASRERVTAFLPQGTPLTLQRDWERVRLRLANLGGKHYHLVYHREDLGQGFYFAREANARREALWLSRRLGYPVPPQWLPLLEERLSLPAHGGRALKPLPIEVYHRLRQELLGKAEAEA